MTLLLPIGNADAARIDASIASLLEQSERRWQLLLLDDARATAVPGPVEDPRIGRCATNRVGVARALNEGLGRAEGAFVAVLGAGDQLSPDALQIMLREAERLHADILYSDEETLPESGPACNAFAKPDWSPELLLAFPYTGRLCLMRRDLVRSLGGWHDRTIAAEDYALVLAAARADATIRRVDRTLYRRGGTHIAVVCGTPEAVDARRAALEDHLAALADAARVVADDGPAAVRVRWPIAQRPLVSIVIATRDRIALLDQCIQSVVGKTTYAPIEIVIVDNDSADAESRAYFDGTPHRVVRAPGPFNFSAINNAGARAARGEYLLFLNNDTEIISADWIESMLEWAQRPDIGCVGAKLLFADGRIQHAGVTLHDGSAFHPGYGQRPNATTWLESELVRNVSAVTAACLLVRRSVFEEVGGFDESFPVAYNDVDLCVRIMARGYRNLYTPYAVLFHYESSSRTAGVELSENEHLQKVVGDLLWSDPYCPANQRLTPGQAGLLHKPASGRGGRWRRAAARAKAVLAAVRFQRISVKGADVVPAPEDSPPEATADSIDAVKWLDAVDIDGERRIALFMHPVARRTFAIATARPARFVAWLALLPDAWARNSGGVRFAATIRVDGHLQRSFRWVIDPRRKSRHRRWYPVSVPIPASQGRSIELTLETTLPPGATAAHAWAIWGDPTILERKDLGAIATRQIGVIRAIGLKGTVRRYARILRGRPVNVEVYDSWFRQQRKATLDTERIRRTIDAFPYRPRVSLITPVYNTDPRWLQRLVESVAAQTYPDWELCLADDGSTRDETRVALERLGADARIRVVRLAANAGISAASNAALAAATGEFAGLLDHDDELAPDALFEVVKLLNAHRDADIVYTDEDKLEFDGTHVEPYFKPDWSPEYLRSTMYIGHLTVYRRALVDRIGGFRSEFDGSQDYDLVLRATSQTTRVHHIPRVLYHWRKTQGSAAGDTTAKPWGLIAARRALEDHVATLAIPATVEDQPGHGFWRVRYQILGNPLVSVVIPTDGRIVQTRQGNRDLLWHCIRSIVQRTTYRNYELLIADNGRLSPQVLALLSEVPHRRLVYEMTQPFNFAAKVNFAARQARGEHLLLLNDDTEVINEEWMSAMLEFSQQAEIGAVGGKLFYPDGRIQHVGVVLGIGGGACHVLAGQAGDSPGYFGSALVIRNYSAVTGACCMTRRAVFEEVGGFDERFALDFNDVDYCLRLGARGYRIVGTPFARLYHFEGASFGSREHVVNPAEVKALSERWSTVIEADPFYNPNLTRSGLDYSLRL
ncbi:MAG TPA: glycosyltransferase [Vicinamibacterales bacterium]|nr:glycosyltransferase [Vicinamibacterales bacterium]